MKKKQLFIFLLCYIAYTAIYIARLNLSMAAPALKAASVLTSAQYGTLGSVFSVVYAIGRLVNGALSDKRPPWFMISIGLALCGLGNIAFSFFPPYAGLIISWGVNAFAQSMLWSSILCTLSSVYGDGAKKKTSLMVTAVAAGNVLGIVLGSFFISSLSLRWAFLIPGGVTLVLSLLTLIFLFRIKVPEYEGESHFSMAGLIKNPEIRTVLVPAFLHGVMKDNVTLWMTAFFVERFMIDLNESAAFVLFIPLVGLAGRLSYPLFYKLAKENEHAVSMYMFAVCIVSSLVLCLFPVSPVPAAVCLALIYAAVSVANTSFLSIYPIRFSKSGNIASVSGLMDFFTYLGAGAASLIYGLIVDDLGYVSIFASWAAVSVISLAVLFFLVKKGGKEGA